MSKRQQIATLKGLSKDIASLKRRPRNAIGLLIISLGQLYHEGDFIISTLKTMNRAFTKVYIVIADQLQAYNKFTETDTLFSEEKLSEYRQQLSEESEAWQDRYDQHIKGLVSYEVETWDKFLNDQNFTAVKNFILALYEGVPNEQNDSHLLADYKRVFQALRGEEYSSNSVSQDKTFVEKVKKSARKKIPKKKISSAIQAGIEIDQNQEKYIPVNIQYVMEECIVYIQWALKWPGKNIFLVYPSEISPINPAIIYLKQRFLSENTLRSLAIKFSPALEEEYSPELDSTLATYSDDEGSDEEKKASSLVSIIPEQCHATNIVDVKLAFQRNLLHLIQLAINFDLHSYSVQIQDALSTFLQRIVREIPIIVNEENPSSQNEELSDLPQEIKKFLAFVFFDMQLISEMVKDPKNIDPNVLTQWCKKLNGYVNTINNLIDTIDRSKSDAPSNIEKPSIPNP